MIGLGLSINRGGLLNKFGLSALFKSGETGVIFDPSTTGTLYTTTAMTIPATPGDPVGMMLDQSQWGGAALGALYGDELVTNGTFDTDVAGWASASAGVFSWVAGQMQVEVLDGDNNGGATQTVTIEVGKTYTWSVDVTALTENGLILLTAFGFNSGTFSAPQVFTGTFTATTTTLAIEIYAQNVGAGPETLTVDNVSVREVTVANALAPILGPELVTNGDGTDVTGWTITNNGGGSTLVSSGGSFVFTSDFTVAYATIAVPTTVGKTYRFSVDVTAKSAGVYIRGGPTAGGITLFGDNNAPDIKTYTYTAVPTSGTQTFFNIGALSGNTVTFDNVTVKEIPGYHATQATAAKRPTYGIHPFGGRRNLLVYSEDFSNAAWTKASVTVADNAAVTPDGASSFLMYPNTTGTNRWIYQADPVGIPAGQFTFSLYAKASGKSFIVIDPSGGGTVGAYFDLSSGTIGTVAGAFAASILSVGDGWYRCSLTTDSLTYASTFAGVYSVVDADGSRTVTANGTDGVLISSAQFETSATATAYQKVTSQYVVTETGVPSVHYLKFDGVDDAMATPSIDFSASDEMSVFAGVRKLSDATQG
jgi:hypothetical protein